MRQFSVGAECLDGGVDFRVWALGRTRISLQLEHEPEPHALQPGAEGYFSLYLPRARPGMRYRYLVDGQGPYPDPAARYQPEGPHGPSEIIDARSFRWRDANWAGSVLRGQVFYELHVGTFTQAGTWQAAQAKLPQLRELGVTCVELMPINDFPGEFGWSYDGVALYAPHSRYGRPDDLREFVDAAHRLGLAVILDVVYNHLGPADNYLPAYSPHYLSPTDTEWGACPNFDGAHARAVRDFVCDNAAYWIREFHMDGFRLDASHSLYDCSSEHIIAELTRRARAAAQGRPIMVVAENEPQHSRLMRSVAADGYGIDGMWNDDFHHSAVVRLTGRREAYYSDYSGRTPELVAAAKHGFLFQGQYYSWQKQRRGTSTRGLPAHAFIAYIENHDQISNTAAGHRLHQVSNPGAYRALTSLLLLGPWTPLLFQGQEWASTRPFPYFAHHAGELALRVRSGRNAALSQFPSLASRAVVERMPDPKLHATFESAKLDWTEDRESVRAQQSLALHRDLLQLRNGDPVLRPGASDVEFDAVALGDERMALRWFDTLGSDRLLLVNFGPDAHLSPAPEPLLAPPDGRAFDLLFSTEEPRYGGLGQPDDSGDRTGFRLPAYSALLFVAIAREAP